MFKFFIIAAILACANGYYNHGAVGHEGYYGNYGHASVAPVPLAALNHGNIYNHGYNGHIGAVGSQTKIIPADYPGAVHNKGSGSYAVANPTGYIGAQYSHGSLTHGSGPSYVRAPSVIAGHPSIAYNHGIPATTYAHSHYAVNEGATNYAAHSRYAIAGAPALSYGHQSHYPGASAGPIYSHALPVDHRVQKIAYNPAISHMAYPSHAAPTYSW